MPFIHYPVCSTTVAVLDVTASTAIYAGKTEINIDAVILILLTKDEDVKIKIK